MYIKKFYKYNYDLILELDHEHCKHFICEDDFKLLFRVFNIINEYDLTKDDWSLKIMISIIPVICSIIAFIISYIRFKNRMEQFFAIENESPI